jgi:hypothetical protein
MWEVPFLIPTEAEITATVFSTFPRTFIFYSNIPVPSTYLFGSGKGSLETPIKWAFWLYKDAGNFWNYCLVPKKGSAVWQFV